MKQFDSNVKRLEWLDICKGILIILMVTGHSTGLFNKYIYQFHIAAFFFFSGYTSHPEKRNLVRTLFDKFFTILFPVIVTVLLGIAILWLLHFNHLETLFSAWEFPGWKKILAAFFLRGDNYVSILGANWFLISLFGICVLNKLIDMLVYGSSAWNLIISIALYLAGYALIKMNYVTRIGMFAIDLVLIGNLFYAGGNYLQKSHILEQMALSKIIWSVLLFIFSTGGIYLVECCLHIIIDWPSRTFTHPLFDGMAALNGIVFTFSASLLINHFFRRIGRLFCFIGRNTLGILFFHFTFFKVMYFPFYWSGIITKDEFSCLTPTSMASPKLTEMYWFIIAAGSIALSLLTWRLMLHSKVWSFLVGQDKLAYANIWNAITSTKIATRLVHISNAYLDKIKVLKLYAFKTYKKNRLLCYSIVLIVLLAAIPLYKQAIMCNDELQSRLWSMKGFAQFFRHYAIKDYIAKGRALSVIVDPFCMYLGFWGSSNWMFRLVQILSILLDAIMFSWFLFKLFKNKYFSLICGLSVIMFLPITFEHTAPNAFNTLFNIPFALLFISLVLFINYLECEKKKTLIISLVLLFITFSSYESFVTLLPLYWGVVLWKIGLKNRRLLIKKCIYPTIIALIFVICYWISGIIMKTSYSGNMLGGFSLKSSLKIILQLVKASFPGYYLFSPKYKYLFTYYNNLDLENIIRILLMCLIFGGIIYYLAKETIRNKSEHPTKIFKFLGILGMGIICIILPTCPIAVSKMYQGHVGPDGFMALPTTFFTYFAATFVCWFLIWNFIQKVQRKSIILFVTIGITCYSLPIQAMNDVFAEQQNQDFQRLTVIESLFSTELMKLFDGHELKSSDLFTTKNALAIHAPYWTDFAHTQGRNIQISQDAETLEDICLYFDGSQFTIRIKNEICVITRFPKIGYGICQYTEKDYILINYENPIQDNEFYIYFYRLSEDNTLVTSNRDIFVQQLIGSTLQNCLKEYGYYEDGWVAKVCQSQIRTGERGKIDIDIYCPLTDFDDKKIAIYVDDTLIDTIELQEYSETISINATSNQVICLRLEANFVQENTGDMRELAMVISSMKGY